MRFGIGFAFMISSSEAALGLRCLWVQVVMP